MRAQLPKSTQVSWCELDTNPEPSRKDQKATKHAAQKGRVYECLHADGALKWVYVLRSQSFCFHISNMKTKFKTLEILAAG